MEKEAGRTTLVNISNDNSTTLKIYFSKHPSDSAARGHGQYCPVLQRREMMLRKGQRTESSVRMDSLVAGWGQKPARVEIDPAPESTDNL